MKKLFILFMFFLFLSGTGSRVYAQEAVKPASAAPQGDPNFVLADKCLGRTALMYQNYIKGMFDYNIATDAPARNELIGRVDQNQRAGKVLELSYFIDGVVQDAGLKTLAASIKWEKRTQPKGAREAALSKGKATVVFKQQGNGDWLLYQVNGENPF